MIMNLLDQIHDTDDFPMQYPTGIYLIPARSGDLGAEQCNHSLNRDTMEKKVDLPGDTISGNAVRSYFLSTCLIFATTSRNCRINVVGWILKIRAWKENRRRDR